MRVLAVDPGYDRTGVAVLEKKDGKETLSFSTCIETDRKKSDNERLLQIGSELDDIIAHHKPDLLAIETLFLTKNQKTAMLVAAARGVVLYIASTHKLPVQEFSPLQVKVAITGYGKSEKKQVAYMVSRLISINKKVQRDDEYDAIAIALTALTNHRA